MKPSIVAAALALALFSLGLAAGVAAQDKAAASGAATPRDAGTDRALATPDRTFMTQAASDGMAEVAMGKLGEEKASHAQVRDFARRMVSDHGRANKELKALAGKKGVQLPSTPQKHHLTVTEKLKKLAGPAFDKEYMRHMVEDHKQAVADFSNAAKSGTDADVKAFASKTLPTLQEHLKLAQTTHAAVRDAAPAGAKK